MITGKNIGIGVILIIVSMCIALLFQNPNQHSEGTTKSVGETVIENWSWFVGVIGVLCGCFWIIFSNHETEI